MEKDSGISPDSVDQIAFPCEGSRRVGGAVKTNGARSDGLGQYEGSAIPGKHLRVREMKWFIENDATVMPVPHILARREADHSTARFAQQDFKQHIPNPIALDHERVREVVR